MVYFIMLSKLSVIFFCNHRSFAKWAKIFTGNFLNFF